MLQLATCFNKIDLPAFTERVMAALTDINEVKVLGLMLLLRLGQLSPSSVVPRLDEAVDSMKAMMMDLEVKEDTIQQDLERKGLLLTPEERFSSLRADGQPRCRDRLCARQCR
jgi:cullin-associated NEDD8-dissociated protein 1